ncbi:uncharacterized protein [Montipora foliosa]|uniref:uncharacterized protein n=1 Tax=Montipora foliosa TaxID=591990 RepID=UPI0035F137A1
MAACGFFRARTLLYCWRRNFHLKETFPARTTLVNSVYLRKIVSGIQCFPSFKGNSIDRYGHRERIKDSQSGHKYGEWTHQKKSFCLFFFATFYGLYFVCSTNIAYAGDREDEKPNYESRRHKGCFASKRQIQSVANLTRAKKCITQGNENHPEEEQDFEPPRKIETRSQQPKHGVDICGTRLIELHVLRNDLKSCSNCKEDGLVGIAVSYDMGWQKRGRGHNSSTGHGAAMGLATGKVVSYSTRCKTCRVCSHNKLTGKDKRHDCRKNHSGSSKSMERDVACELWSKAPKSGVKFSIYVGDDDSTTLADIKNKIPYGVEKWSDIVHAKRSLNSRLYNLRDRFKGSNCSVLSPKVINYLTKCFSYCINQNVGDSNSLKKGLKNIVPHAFGDHTCCDNSWCGYKQNPAAYKHTDLPYGKDLFGDSLKKALIDILEEYSTDIVVNKLAPCANSQRNESLNSTVGSKNPKTRFYGGSESNNFRVACGVAQTNIGYDYIGKTLEALNIEPGYYHKKHANAMDRKVICDKQRKGTKQFKRRRNQLSQQQNQQALRTEANEGITYESSVGLNLDTSSKRTEPQIVFDVPTKLSQTELRRYEEILPPYTARPKVIHLSYDSTNKYQFIIFDTETTCTGKLAEICQLSAVSENGRHEFSTFILPQSSISYSAYLVNGMTIKNIRGIRTLYHRNNPVQSVTIEEALRDFLTFIKQIKNCDEVENNLTVLIGHNSATFDVPILLRNSDDNFKDSLNDMNVYFADSLQLVKNLIKDKHKALEIETGGYCKPNQSSLYTHLFNEQFDAHDALEDVRALRKILFESSLSLSRKDIVENSSITSVSHAVENMLHLDRRHELLLTFSDKLFNTSDTGPIKRSMALNIADSGLSYDDIYKLYTTFGKRALVAILSNPPTSSSAKAPRVTRTKRILTAIVKHFDEISHEE